VRVGYASIGVGNRPFVGGSSAALAHAEGYLEAEFKDDPDVRIEWSFFKGAGPAVNEAIANGQLDFALQGDLPSIIGRANGLETRLLLASGAHQATYLAVPPGSDIRNVKDLAGRKMAMFRGTNHQLAIAKVLAANGLSERDIKIINMDTATMSAALASRDVDAAFGEPALLDVAGKGLAEIIYTTKGDNPAFERHAHILATAAFEAAHPDITGRVVKAFVRAAQFASDETNREQVFEIWARSGIPADRYRKDFDGESMRYRNSPLFDDFLKDQYRIQAEQARAYGLVRRDVDVSGWFELSYLEAAVRELQLQDYWTHYDLAGKPQGS
jgi:sulfonate transport system substrate-binding protein